MEKGDLEQAGAQIGPDAYKRLYPADFYKKFIDNKLRPDGRAFGGGRPVTIGVGAIESADASALVKIGSTSVLAGLNFTIQSAGAEPLSEGELEVVVSSTALSLGSADRRKGLDVSSVLTYQVERAIRNSQCLDLSKFVSKTGKMSLKASLAIYILDGDGAELDCCLLAAIASLASVKHLPHSKALNEIEQGGDEDMKVELDSENNVGFCELESIPLYHTIGVYGDHLMVDPTSEEELLMDGLVTIALDSQGSILGFNAHRPASCKGMALLETTDCLETAKLRHKDVKQLLIQALQAYGSQQ